MAAKYNLEQASVSQLRELVLETLFQDPLLSDLGRGVTLEDLEFKIDEEGGMMLIHVKRFDGQIIDVEVTKRGRMKHLKRAIAQEVTRLNGKEHRVQINWRYVWSRYVLAYQQSVLYDDNAELQSYGIKNGSEIKFVRRLQEKRKKKPRNYD